MSTKLFVGGLSWDTTEDSLRNFFSQAGNVVSAKVITDKFSGKSRGFGFVEMGSEQETKEAITKLNGQTLDGRTITVNEARPQAPREGNYPREFDGRKDYRQDRRGSQGKRSFR